MKRLLVLIFVLSIAGQSLQVFSQHKHHNKDKFSFVFMTDIHVQPELSADKGLMAAIKKVNELNPDFVITGGDLIMDALGQTKERADSLYLLNQKLQKQTCLKI